MANETSNDIRDFHEQLKATLPRLRIYALSLTRDRDAADDLVHDTVIKALTGRHSFQPGTNLAAWLFRIQRNEFISGLRRQRPTVPVDTAIAESLSHPAHQDSGLVMREFVSAFAKLAPTQREALLLAVLEGLPYEVIAAAHRRVGGHREEPHHRAPATRSSACCSRATPSRVRPSRQLDATRRLPRRRRGASRTASANPLPNVT